MLLYEIKFLVPHYSCHQKSWPCSLSSQSSNEFVKPPQKKFLGTPLVLTIVNLVTVTTLSIHFMQYGKHYLNIRNKIETLKPYLHTSSQL